MRADSVAVGTVNDDEISLHEVWQTLVRQKRVFFLLFAFAVIAAVAYLALAKRIYQVETSIYIGNFAENSGGTPLLLEEPIVVVKRLESELPHEDASAGWISKVTEDRKDPRFIRITAQGVSPEASLMVAQTALNKILARHTAEYDENQNAVEAELVRLEARLHKGQQLVLEASDKGRQDLPLSVASISLVAELGAIEKRVSEIKAYLRRSARTEVINPPVLPMASAHPKVALVSALALMGGFFLGVMGAFVAESLTKARAE